MAKRYGVVGLMSGTSMDGVDLAYCEFELKNNWEFNIIFARTYSYTQKWKDLLSNISDIDQKHVESIHRELGEYYGRLIQNFCQEYQLTPDFISSHGHTVYHKPDKGITLQIGSGSNMSRITHQMVVNDFRSRDVKLGGQGAPLVPIGDQLLFSEYDCCLNLGGICNISYEKDGERIAYDISPMNMPLNELARSVGKEYDAHGALASEGTLDEKLLKELNALAYYRQSPPKSLGVEWYKEIFREVLFKNRRIVQDALRTVVEHIAQKIAEAITPFDNGKLLITGGGAYNDFLISRIQALSNAQIILPEKNLIEYKEALIFAFLGVLRVENKINVLASVTGACQDHCSGVIHNP